VHFFGGLRHQHRHSDEREWLTPALSSSPEGVYYLWRKPAFVPLLLSLFIPIVGIGLASTRE
jgi:hypothetical protein